MAQDDGGAARQRQPLARHVEVHAHSRQRPGGQPQDRGNAFADVDQQYRQTEELALGPQGVGRARVAAAQGTDVHASQTTEDQAAQQRAQEVGEQRLDSEFEHGLTMISETLRALGQVDFRQHAAHPAAPCALDDRDIHRQHAAVILEAAALRRIQARPGVAG